MGKWFAALGLCLLGASLSCQSVVIRHPGAVCSCQLPKSLVLRGVPKDGIVARYFQLSAIQTDWNARGLIVPRNHECHMALANISLILRDHMTLIAKNLANVETTSVGTVPTPSPSKTGSSAAQGSKRHDGAPIPPGEKSGETGASRQADKRTDIRHIPYRRKVLVLEMGPDGKPRGKVTEDQTAFRTEFNPEHPHAVHDPEAGDYGRVYYPNVNPIVEMVDMIAVSRRYEIVAGALGEMEGR